MIRSVAALGLLLMSFPPSTSVASVTEVAPGVHLLRGAFVPGQQPDGNSIIFDAPEGLVIVDTGRHREHTQALIDYAGTVGKKPKAIINTHWHLDHVGGNVLFRSKVPGIRIFASGAIAGAQKGFLASYRSYLEQAIPKSAEKPEEQQNLKNELALIDAGAKLAPDEIVSSSGVRKIAGRSLVLNLESRAVTEGDLWIFDKVTGVLVSGDLVTLPVPFLDTACPEGWKNALEKLSKTDFRILVPGHGAPMTRAQFEIYRKAYGELIACTASSRESSVCEGGWIENLGDLLPSTEHEFTKSLIGYYVNEVLRGDQANIAKLCGS